MGACLSSSEEAPVSHPDSFARDKYNRETSEATETLVVRPRPAPCLSLIHI